MYENWFVKKNENLKTYCAKEKLKFKKFCYNNIILMNLLICRWGEPSNSGRKAQIGRKEGRRG